MTLRARAGVQHRNNNNYSEVNLTPDSHQSRMMIMMIMMMIVMMMMMTPDSHQSRMHQHQHSIMTENVICLYFFIFRTIN